MPRAHPRHRRRRGKRRVFPQPSKLSKRPKMPRNIDRVRGAGRYDNCFDRSVSAARGCREPAGRKDPEMLTSDVSVSSAVRIRRPWRFATKRRSSRGSVAVARIRKLNEVRGRAPPGVESASACWFVRVCSPATSSADCTWLRLARTDQPGRRVPDADEHDPRICVIGRRGSNEADNTDSHHGFG